MIKLVWFFLHQQSPNRPQITQLEPFMETTIVFWPHLIHSLMMVSDTVTALILALVDSLEAEMSRTPLCRTSSFSHSDCQKEMNLAVQIFQNARHNTIMWSVEGPTTRLSEFSGKENLLKVSNFLSKSLKLWTANANPWRVCLQNHKLIQVLKCSRGGIFIRCWKWEWVRRVRSLFYNL